MYLDNAATSWPKPAAVYEAVDNYQRNIGASAGRSAYSSASDVARIVDQARSAVARLTNASNPQSVVFALNGTDALNIAIHGTLRQGDHVVTTVVEHNSVLRPLSDLGERLGISVTQVDCDDLGILRVADIESALRPNTRLVVASHVSNVTGAIQPIEDIAQVVSKHPALLLVDGAQSLGHIKVDVGCGIDLLASSGHKGLLGPLGTGVLVVGETAADSIKSFRQGGTGTSSEEDRQPKALPEKLESGNLNVPGIVGLLAGIRSLHEKGLENLRQHEIELTEQALASFAGNRSLTVYGPKSSSDRVGVVSFRLEGHDPHELATLLDTIAGIETRSGLHCAPQMHRRLGTLTSNGAVRMSLGVFNQPADIDLLASTLLKL